MSPPIIPQNLDDPDREEMEDETDDVDPEVLIQSEDDRLIRDYLSDKSMDYIAQLRSIFCVETMFRH